MSWKKGCPPLAAARIGYLRALKITFKTFVLYIYLNVVRAPNTTRYTSVRIYCFQILAGPTPRCRGSTPHHAGVVQTGLPMVQALFGERSCRY